MRDGIEPRKSGSGLGFLTEERGPAAEAERSRLLAGGGGGVVEGKPSRVWLSAVVVVAR